MRGEWQCLNIETRTPWPTKPQTMIFEGHTLWLMPHTTDHYPGIAVNRPVNLSADDTWALLHRAISLISWIENTGVMVTSMTGGNLPRMMGLGKATFGVALSDTFDFSDLPPITTSQGQLALALIREGRGLNHPAYAFLSFYRAFETAVPDKHARVPWIREKIDKIQGHRATEALKKLKQNITGDIGKHLRDSGRHAIAHASIEPVINPDDPRDARRLREELPVMEGLAVLAVETELGILTRTTLWKQHLYELRGWKLLFGDEITSAMAANVDPPRNLEIDLPPINVRLLRSAPFPPLMGMVPVQGAFGEQKIEVVYRSTDGLVDLVFWLNFATERLEFDPSKSLVAFDDGSVGAARNGKELHRFFCDYIGNGSLQMWNADSGELISRCDAFIPVNCFLDNEANAAIAAQWDELIAARETQTH